MIRDLAPAAILLAASLLAAGGRADADDPIGRKIADLEFVDTRSLPRSLADLGPRRAFVLVFVRTTCPLVRRYLPELDRLERQYRGRGVQFLALDVGDDSIAEIAALAIEHGVEFPFGKDRGGTCARALDARRTPEVAVLDGERRLRYRGRIDDQYRLGGARPSPARRDLREALEDLLAGREIAVPRTPVDGCLIPLTTAPHDAARVTFAEHVAPLLARHCQECHRPGGDAPFPLQTFRQVADLGETVAEVVDLRRMPPWYAGPEHGRFVNARGLTDPERATILRWVRDGMPEGDPAASPPRPASPGRWKIGEPDLVLRMAVPHVIPAHGEVDDQHAVLPHLFLRETWVQAVEILPDNPRVVHHGNLAIARPGAPLREEEDFVTGRVPGGDPLLLDEGTAPSIPAGSFLGLQVHYVTSGQPERSRIAVGLRFPRGPVRRQLRVAILAAHGFAIPPGAPAHAVGARCVLGADAVGVGMFAHMHLRGRDVTFTARHPDGRVETLLRIPNYNFDWQQSYRWEPGSRSLPRGTMLEVLAHFDNSAFNPYNPDPTATVREGRQTREEMMYGFVFYTRAGEDLGLQIDPRSGQILSGTRPEAVVP